MPETKVQAAMSLSEIRSALKSEDSKMSEDRLEEVPKDVVDEKPFKTKDYTGKKENFDMSHPYAYPAYPASGGCYDRGIGELAVLGMMWNQNRFGYGGYGGNCGCGGGGGGNCGCNTHHEHHHHGDKGGCRDGFDSIRDMQLSEQIHGAKDHGSILGAISSGDASLQRDVLDGKNCLGEKLSSITCQLGSLKDCCCETDKDVLRTGASLERDIYKTASHTSDRINGVERGVDRAENHVIDKLCGLGREIDGVDRHLTKEIDCADRHISDEIRCLEKETDREFDRVNDRLCNMEKSNIRDFNKVERDIQDCCCELKSEGLRNTQRILDEVRCNREKDLEKENLSLRNELSNNRQTKALIEFLISAGVTPTAAAALASTSNS